MDAAGTIALPAADNCMHLLVVLSALALILFWLDGLLQLVGKHDETILAWLAPGVSIGAETPTHEGGLSMYPSDLIVKFMKSFQNGSLCLIHGKHDVEVSTHSKPKQIWVCEEDRGSMQVCQGGGNKFGWTYLEDGFVLHADVDTDYTQVRYEVIF